MLDEVLKELEDAIQVTMNCDLHPEVQRCRVGYLSRRIAQDTFKARNYVHRTAVLIELLKNSKERKKKRMNMRGYGFALFTFLDEIFKIEDAIKEEEFIEIDDHQLDNSNSTDV